MSDIFFKFEGCLQEYFFQVFALAGSGRRTRNHFRKGEPRSGVGNRGERRHGLNPLVRSRVGTGCNGYKIFGPPNQSGKIFGRLVEFGWSLVVTNRGKLYEK